MKTALVGCTGFVGSNICRAAGDQIQFCYHSTDIREAWGTRPDLLIYAGLRAEKYLANHEPEKDRQLTLEAMENIRRIAPGQLVLISTIDVLKDSRGADESAIVEEKDLEPYGLHRFQLEKLVREYDPEALIIRLPGLFGHGLKKNFLYDFLHVIPTMLKKEKMEELCGKDGALRQYYPSEENGFFRVRALEPAEERKLKDHFRSLGFSALNFTDSRGKYQFYSLGRLWKDLQTARNHGLRLWHAATEPVSAAEIYRHLTGEDFRNELPGNPADYDFRTLYAELFGGENGYISPKGQVLEQIRAFMQAEGKC